MDEVPVSEEVAAPAPAELADGKSALNLGWSSRRGAGELPLFLSFLAFLCIDLISTPLNEGLKYAAWRSVPCMDLHRWGVGVVGSPAWFGRREVAGPAANQCTCLSPSRGCLSGPVQCDGV